MFENDSIIITMSNKEKEELYLNNNILNNIKIFSVNEFFNKYYYEYNEEAIIYLQNKYNVIRDVAIIYLDNIIYLENKLYTSNKINRLNEMKKELVENGMILFKKNLILNRYKIFFYGFEPDNTLKKIMAVMNLKFKVIGINKKDYINKIHEFYNMNDEVEYIAGKISLLISNGVNANKICILNTDDDYKKLIKKIFGFYNIPINVEKCKKIYGTPIVQEFINDLNNKDISEIINDLQIKYSTEEDIKIINKIVAIVNSLVFVDNKELKNINIKNKLKAATVSIPQLKYAVSFKDLESSTFNDDDYVFLVSFNQGVIPINYKDEDYFNDIEKSELGIATTLEKNVYERKITLSHIRNIKNLIITYKLKNKKIEYTISNLNDDLNYEIVKKNRLNKTYSNLYNKLILSEYLDEYNKYGTIKEDLIDLANHYRNLEYKHYDNRYTLINSDNLKKYLNNRLVLSYSSLDKYYRCPFAFYLNYILKINVFESTFKQNIGNIFHEVLEKYKGNNFLEAWNGAIEKIDELTESEKHFLNNLKEELKFIIETNVENEKYTELNTEEHEFRINKQLQDKPFDLRFTGVIDKVKYDEKLKIASIIDYKTGNVSLSLNDCYYGIGMQLPTYIYLLKNNEKFKDYNIAGFYLQKILNSKINCSNKDIEKEKKNNLKLQGYSNENINILSKFDSSYKDSLLIKSLKINLDGSFNHNAKIISNDNIEKLNKLVETKINECFDNVLNANFNIEPKKIDKNNLGCSICKFKDICYHTSKDIIELEKKELSDLYGGIQ